RQLSLAVLDIDAPLPPAQPRLVAPCLESGKYVLHESLRAGLPAAELNVSGQAAQDRKRQSCYNHTKLVLQYCGVVNIGPKKGLCRRAASRPAQPAQAHPGGAGGPA